jgi:tRNA nucleotidyltransferase (CCA-adding enzyme)
MRSNQRMSAARALGGLCRRAEIVALARAAARRSVAAWIVGGAPRDRLLGVAVPEVDVAVSGDAEGLAGELEREGLGRSVFLSRDRPGPRVFRVAGKRPLDIAELEGGSIETDLRRRDFTANAIALSVPSGQILDPFGGVADLRKRRLRCVREENLAEDPLRILRAARLFATHALRPDRRLLEASRRAAPLFGRAAPERVAAELSRLLASPAAAPALAWAARAGILPAALGRDMSPQRAASLARSTAVLDGRAARDMAPSRRRRLRLALLAVRLRLTPSEARGWLQERRWARGEAQEAAHVVGLVASARGIRTRRNAWSWVLEAGALGEDALALLSRLGAAGRRRARGLRPFVRAPLRTVRVTGGDVVNWLGIEPGPRVGQMLGELRIAAATGEVRNRRQARNWLTGQVRGGPVTGYNV